MRRSRRALSPASLLMLLPLLTGGRPAARPGQETPAAPQQNAVSGEYQVFFVFHSEDVQGALPEFGRLLELAPLHVDPGIQGTLTKASSNPISREDAFQVFLGILRDCRAVLIRTPDPAAAYEIVPEAAEAPGAERVTELPPALPRPNAGTVPGVAGPKREPLRVNEKLQASKLTRLVQPVIPEAAARARIEARGPVRLRVLVNEQGEVADVRIYGGGHPLLQRPAAEAVKQWRYSPFCLNGDSVPVVTTVQVAFDGEQSRDAAPALEIARAVTPMRVGSSAQANRLIRRVEPEFTELARRARLRGTVLLEVTIDERGTVRDVRYLRGHRLVEQAVVDAVRQWRYAPACIDGTAVPVLVSVQVPFDLREP